MKFYVINLKRSPQRRQLMCEQLDKFGVDYEIFEASDGRALTPEEEAMVGTSDQVILDMAGGRQCLVEDKLSPAEMGCIPFAPVPTYFGAWRGASRYLGR